VTEVAVEVTPVTSPHDLGLFLRLPWTLYRDDPQWVPPLVGEAKAVLDPKRNPFFEHGEIRCFLARRDGRVVGRVAAIRNRNHESFHDERCGFFGFFECEDDPEAAGALVGAARAWNAERRLDTMRGPVNPSTNDESGVLVDGFDTPPRVMMPHARPYYDALLTGAGLRKAKDLLAYWMERPPSGGVPERLSQGADLALRRTPGLAVRPFDKKDFAGEVERFRRVYNAAWERNWGFVPMTDAEIDHMAKQLKQVLDPGLIRIAEVDGETVGFALALPDMNQAIRHANGRLFPLGLVKILWHARRIDVIRVLVLGVVEGYRKRGIDVVMYRDLFAYGLSKGYRGGEFSWILEDNAAIRRPLEVMGARVYKTYRIYEGSTQTPSR
jgi:hypothetical protein